MLKKFTSIASELEQSIQQGKYDQTLQKIMEMENSLSGYSSYFDYFKANILRRKGNYNQAIEIINELESSEIDDQVLRSYIYLEKAYILWHQTDYDHSQRYIQRSNNIIDKFKSSDPPIQKLKIISSHINGNIYVRKGFLDKALNSYNESLTLRKRTGINYDVTTVLQNVATINILQGNIEDAKSYHEEALKIGKELGNPQIIAKATYNLGLIEIDTGNSDKGINMAIEALNTLKSIEIGTYVFEILVFIFEFSLKNNRPEIMEKSYYEMKDLIKKTNNYLSNLYYLYVEGLYFKYKDRLFDKIRGVQILKNIIEDEIRDSKITLRSTMEYCDFLLDEYKLYENEKVYNELEEITDTVFTYANNQNIYPIQIEMLILKSKLKLLKSDVDTSIELLDSAIQIAENNYPNLEKRISEQRNEIIYNMEIWVNEDLNLPLSKKIEQTKIHNYIRSVSDYLDSRK